MSSRVNGTRKGKLGLRKKQYGVLVDFSRLDMSSLKKYRAFFGLDVPPTATKAELVKAVKRHFATERRLRDAEVISHFLAVNNRAKMRLAQQ